MSPACHCGMVEDHGRQIGCAECGTPCCASCGIEFDATTFCRWCATTSALARPA